MFSKACEYALRAMIFIAQKTQVGQRSSIKDIATGVDSPEHFMAKILQDLSRKGLVESVKGPNGGFYMNALQLKATLAEIVSAIDSSQLFTGCGLGLKTCSEKNPCPLHDEFKVIRKKIQSMLETTNVGEFNKGLEDGLIFLKRI